MHPTFTTALITGASTGIGSAYCKDLAQKKCDLVMVARNKEALDILAAQLEKEYGIKAYVYVQDLAKEDATKNIFNFCNKHQLSIDLLINNAGYGDANYFIDASIEQHNAMLDVMLRSTVELCHAFLPTMLKNNNGYIINVSSVAGLIGFAVKGKFARSLYRPIKSFIVAFTQQMGATYGNQGIHFQCLCPGLTITEFHRRINEEKLYTSIPKLFWMSASQVTKYSLIKLKKNSNKPIIPGIINKFFVFLYKLYNLIT